MKNIQKKPEPISLTEHRCNTHTNYDNYADKDDLRNSLVDEQRGICCYCMQRIQPNLENMKIEHWKSQKYFSAKQLDYDNLLGACLGGMGKPYKDQHCDTRKQEKDLSFNPASQSHDVEKMFMLPGSGRIEAKDPQLQKELEDILNLNHPRLVSNRKAVIDSFTQLLRNNAIRDSDLPKYLASWEGKGEGKLEPFCQVVIYYLRKKIEKLNRPLKTNL
jgi:uncharacterized protein (TIGR02646 family)